MQGLHRHPKSKLTAKKMKQIKLMMQKRSPVQHMIRKAKLQQELKFMYNMTKPIIDMALADKFSKPRKLIRKYKAKNTRTHRALQSVTTMASISELNTEMVDLVSPQKEKLKRVRSSPIDKLSLIKAKTSTLKSKISQFDIFEDKFDSNSRSTSSNLNFGAFNNGISTSRIDAFSLNMGNQIMAQTQKLIRNVQRSTLTGSH